MEISSKVIVQFVPDASMATKLRLVGLEVAWSFARTEQEGKAISTQHCLVVLALESSCPAQMLLHY